MLMSILIALVTMDLACYFNDKENTLGKQRIESNVKQHFKTKTYDSNVKE